MATSQELAVRYEGQGCPVLFIHGWEISGAVEAHDFEPIFNQKPGYRRIYIDLPGMGNTKAGQDIKDLDSMLDSVSRFVEKHILPSNFLLIGSSCGAYLERALAYRYASHVDGLFLRVPLIEPLNEKRHVDPFVPAISNQELMSSFSDTNRERLGDVPVQTLEYIKKLKTRMENVVLPAVKSADSGVLDPIRNDPDKYRLTAAMHSPAEPFTKPSLIVTGRQDTVTGFRDAWPLMKCYPRASFIVLDRADHGLPVDEMEVRLFEALVGNWLSRVEELQKFKESSGST